MANSIYDQYLENEILHADAVKLVGILYRAAIDCVSAARMHLRNGAIRERSLGITRGSEILNHLMLGLNHDAGSEISRNLAELYAYMLHRLMEANANQTEPPLAEVELLLRTLLDGWSEAHATPEPSAEESFAQVANESDDAPAVYSFESAQY
jgi:flagellar secretion chaperone FliS